ncbi:hypothetical protein DFH09DRAFT_1071344 [Mycena vulgaris]|nr:hypothetical protein DFH09DRAFT_1071344 [Mycena vulgaris]
MHPRVGLCAGSHLAGPQTYESILYHRGSLHAVQRVKLGVSTRLRSRGSGPIVTVHPCLQFIGLDSVIEIGLPRALVLPSVPMAFIQPCADNLDLAATCPFPSIQHQNLSAARPQLDISRGGTEPYFDDNSLNNMSQNICGEIQPRCVNIIEVTMHDGLKVHPKFPSQPFLLRSVKGVMPKRLQFVRIFLMLFKSGEKLRRRLRECLREDRGSRDVLAARGRRIKIHLEPLYGIV